MEEYDNLIDEPGMFLFCQAPADVPYLLSIYKKYVGTLEITVCVINVQNTYKFIKGLNLSLKGLIFIPYELSTMKNWKLVWEEKRRLKNLQQTYFKSEKPKIVYFFSRFEDWLTASFITHLAKSKHNIIYYYNHYDQVDVHYKRHTGLNLKNQLKLLMLYYITGACFKFEIINKQPEFVFDKVRILEKEAKLNPDVFEDYFHQIETSLSRKTILLFISSCDITLFNEEKYNMQVNVLIAFLKQLDYDVLIKGHPRIGSPKINDGIEVTFIPDYIPAEFIKIDPSVTIIGIDSFAIIKIAKEKNFKVISLLNMFEFLTDELKRTTFNFLSELSENKIVFIDTLEDLKLKLKESS